MKKSIILTGTLAAFLFSGCKVKENTWYAYTTTMSGNSYYEGKHLIFLEGLEAASSSSCTTANEQAEACANGDTGKIIEMGKKAENYLASILPEKFTEKTNYSKEVKQKIKEDTVGAIVTVEGTNINEKMIREGYDFYTDKNKLSEEEKTKLLEAQDYAKTHNKGLWSTNPNEMSCLYNLYN